MISARLAYAIRLGVGISIGYVVLMWHQGPYAYYIPLTIAMVMLPNVEATVRQSLLRIVGILIGGYGGLLLVKVSSYGDMPLVLALFGITLFFMYFATYYTSARVSFGYVFFAAYLALCLVYFDAVQGKAADYDYFFRVCVSVVGVVIAMVVTAVLQRRQPRVFSKPSFAIAYDSWRMRAAVRAAITAVAALYLTIALSWPKATATVIVAAMIAAIAPTRSSAVKLALMVLVSTWVSCGLVTLLKVFYFPHVNRLPGLLIAVFPLTAFFAYVGNGSRPWEKLFLLVPTFFAGLMLSTDTFNNPLLEPAYRYAQAFSLAAVIGVASHLLFQTARLRASEATATVSPMKTNPM